MFDRNADDEDMAALVEGHFVSILQLAYETSSQQVTKHNGHSPASCYHRVTKKQINAVELDMHGMKACSEARGLESLVCTDIQRTVRKHRQAVLAAQDLLYKKGTPLDSPLAIDLLPKRPPSTLMRVVPFPRKWLNSTMTIPNMASNPPLCLRGNQRRYQCSVVQSMEERSDESLSSIELRIECESSQLYSTISWTRVCG